MLQDVVARGTQCTVRPTGDNRPMKAIRFAILATIVVFFSDCALGQGEKIKTSSTGGGFVLSRSPAFLVRAGTDQILQVPMKSVTNAARSGFSFTPKPVSVTTQPSPSVSPVAAVLVGSVNPSGTYTVAWFEWSADSTFATRDSTLKTAVGSGVADATIRDTLAGLTPGSRYYYRLAARNPAGKLAGTIQYFRTQDYPSSLTLINSVVFPTHNHKSDYVTTDYRMIGLPGDSRIQVANFLSGSPDDNWKLLWDRGTAADWRQAYDGSSTFVFSVGRAFWLLNRGTWGVSTTAPAAALSPLGIVDIPLHPGWNLITDPYTLPVVWGVVQAANFPHASSSPYGFTGAFAKSDTMVPFQGYLFDNTDSVQVLHIPYPNGVIPPGVTTAMDSVRWQVGIELQCEGNVDRTTFLGVGGNLRPGRNSLDFRRPRAIDDVPAVYFNRPEWDRQSSWFATDIHPAGGGLQSWSMEVAGPVQKSMTMMFRSLSAVPSQLLVYLIDNDHMRSIDIRKSPAYSFVHVQRVSQFTVLVGSPEDVEQRIGDVVPVTFALENSFPNPFNPSTSIPVSIPRTSAVSLKIYNILGQEIRTLQDGVIEPGKYWFVWDGKNGSGVQSASGVYIARLAVTSGPCLVIKMIMLK